MSIHKFPAGPRSLRHQLGLTLVELMISVTLGMIIIGSLLGVLAGSSINRASNDRESELQTNGRYAIEFLRRELLHAGFRGNTWAEPGAVLGVGTVTGDCAAGFASNIRQGIWGTNDSNPYSATCLPSSSYSTGDVLVLRRTAYLPVATLNTTTIYFRSAYERGQIYKGTPPNFVSETPYQDYPLEVTVFYVNPFTTSSTESPRVPALYRKTLTTGPAYTTNLVASNVQDMQIQFGRYTTDEKSRYYNANGVSATATSTTTDPTEWDDVNMVRIWLLVRSSSPETGYTNTNSYQLGDKTVAAANDGFRRQVFSTVVQLRN